MGEEKIVALIQESLNVAARTGTAKPSDFTRIIVRVEHRSRRLVGGDFR